RSTVWAPGSDRKDSVSLSPPCRFVSLSRVPARLRETKHDAAIDEFRRTQPILYHFEFGGYAGSGASCVVALSGRDRPASTRLRLMFRRSWESGMGATPADSRAPQQWRFSAGTARSPSRTYPGQLQA